jgi:hypothetical protein
MYTVNRSEGTDISRKKTHFIGDDHIVASDDMQRWRRSEGEVGLEVGRLGVGYEA